MELIRYSVQTQLKIIKISCSEAQARIQPAVRDIRACKLIYVIVIHKAGLNAHEIGQTLHCWRDSTFLDRRRFAYQSRSYLQDEISSSVDVPEPCCSNDRLWRRDADPSHCTPSLELWLSDKRAKRTIQQHIARECVILNESVVRYGNDNCALDRLASWRGALYVTASETTSPARHISHCFRVHDVTRC